MMIEDNSQGAKGQKKSRYVDLFHGDREVSLLTIDDHLYVDDIQAFFGSSTFVSSYEVTDSTFKEQDTNSKNVFLNICGKDHIEIPKGVPMFQVLLREGEQKSKKTSDRRKPRTERLRVADNIVRKYSNQSTNSPDEEPKQYMQFKVVMRVSQLAALHQLPSQKSSKLKTQNKKIDHSKVSYRTLSDDGMTSASKATTLASVEGSAPIKQEMKTYSIDSDDGDDAIFINESLASPQFTPNVSSGSSTLSHSTPVAPNVLHFCAENGEILALYPHKIAYRSDGEEDAGKYHLTAHNIDITDFTFDFEGNKLVQVGKGSFGQVYLGPFEGSKAAIKELDMYDYERNVTILREIVMNDRARGSHFPNLLAFNFDEDSMVARLISDLIEGCQLREALFESNSEHPRLESLEQQLNVAKQVTASIEYPHSFKPPIIHGDLKPENITLTPPEVLVHGQPINDESDIWAASIIIIKIFTRKRAWMSETIPSEESMKQLLEEQKKPDFSGVAIELIPILDKGLERNPKNRYSARELNDHLQEFR
ncbi:hypothetical protein QAD02_002931 [Eretmocerus hayati]|uniref:Uncharacterized protein n=1 Tax=Eretmocerus hayati TaxID=131215 RepID=A0ACC2NKQ4_9HYME|nr:hypothetical protein QAD02_002931 [Eretmocerus hayati]